MYNNRLEITDPTAWDDEEISWDTPISRETFLRLALLSTCEFKKDPREIFKGIKP